MFALIAAAVFAIAFALAMGTIVFMVSAYREKMMAALLYRPMPEETAPVYRIVVARRRTASAMVSRPVPALVRIAA